MSMTWEAFRLTSKSPAEVLHVLGPHGVDDLIRKMMDAAWRESPEEGRTFESVRRIVHEVWGRGIRVWSQIKKPTPQAFFENLPPHNTDQYLRQALVLTWMMLPRSGGRKFSDVRKIVTEIYNRNMAAWAEDHRTFTDTKKEKSVKARKKATKAKARKKPAKGKKKK
jgi:hypothetical protein